MLDQLMSDPSKIGATVLLLLGIGAFYKVLILPRQIHVEAIAQLTTAHQMHVNDMKMLHDAALAKFESDLGREREENNRLRTMVTRNIEVVDKSTEALRLALNAFEHAHAVRREVFVPKNERETEQ